MTTPPLGFLPPPKSFRGLSPRELMSAEDVNAPGTPIGPAGPVVVPLPIKDGELITVMLRQPAAATDYGWGRPRYDCRGQNQVRLIAHVVAAGAFGSRVYLERTTTADNVDDWTTPGASSAEVSVSIESTGWVAGPWIPLGAVGDYGWRAMAKGGDGATTPQILKVHAQFLRASATPQVSVPPSDLPDPIWWSRSGDLMWADDGESTPNDGSDGSDVKVWGDKTGNGFKYFKSLTGNAPILRPAITDPRGRAAVEFARSSSPQYYRQSPLSVAGRQQVTCFVVKKHLTNTPSDGADTGVWHYGRRLGANDAAHPWTDGKVWESFGQGIHQPLNPITAWPFLTRPFDDWHVWCVRSNELEGSSGTMAVFYNGTMIANPGIIGNGNPNRWPIEARGDVEGAAAYLGRSWNHQGSLWVTEIIAYAAALTDAQILTKSTELLGV